MRVLILGNSGINPEAESYLLNFLSDFLLKEGFDVTVMEDVSEILRFKGQPGDFKVTTAEGVFDCDAVVVTAPPRYEAVTCGEKTINFLNDA